MFGLDSPERTIFATITGAGQAPVKLVRLSGPKTRSIVEATCKEHKRILKTPRVSILTEIADGLDYGLVTFFNSPKSFTGEDVAEFHLHGSSFIVKEFLTTLSKKGGFAAAPGEFSMRAYQNGKIDLMQAEAVADLISSQTEAQHRLASKQLAGEFSNIIDDIAEPLRNTLAELDAWLDFPEEEISGVTKESWAESITDVIRIVERQLNLFEGGQIVRDGFKVVLFGDPNVGKSSILNLLCREERSIVTDVAGTTRDSIDVSIKIDGHLVRLWDTAGLRNSTEDVVEEIGIKRSLQHIEDADLRIYVYEAGQKIATREAVKADIVLANKVDLGLSPQSGALGFSAKSEVGLQELKEAIISALEKKTSEDAILTNERHKESFFIAKMNLSRSLFQLNADAALELVSADLRSALKALEEIVGVTSTEDILGRIFSSFCIGK